jgi:hypothetical protein
MSTEITFRLDCEPQFSLAARYTITMLGLIAGFRPRFIEHPDDAGRQTVIYGYGPFESAGVHLAASLPAHQLLRVKQTLDPSILIDREFQGVEYARLFEADDPHGTGCDIISSAFYFLSLHEEWSSENHDMHGRMPFDTGILFLSGKLNRPVVAEYAMLLKAILVQNGIDIPDVDRFGGGSAAFCMTHDIDYLRKWTPGLFYREFWQYLVMNRTGQAFGARIKRFMEYCTFLRRSANPYLVSLDRFLREEGSRKIASTWFVKTGGRDKRDAGYSLRNKRLRSFLREAPVQGHEIGLHPSYRTWNDSGLMAMEKRALERSSGLTLTTVRQHYLRIEVPGTWRIHCGLGLEIDATLCFAGHEGFRNGTCHPFLLWDHEAGSVMPLWELPLLAMDGTFTSYRNAGPDEAIESLDNLFGAVKKSGGFWTVLFHNTVYDPHEFPGWEAVYLNELNRVADHECVPFTAGAGLKQWSETCGYTSLNDVLGSIL